jgi:hypothetical protein
MRIEKTNDDTQVQVGLKRSRAEKSDFREEKLTMDENRSSAG